MKKILITGADGFIGSHLTEILSAQGYNIKALSQYNSFNNWGWIEEINCKEQIEILTGDIRDPHYCKHITKGVDIIFHLAALIAIPYSYVSPLAYIRTNIEGTYNVLEAAKNLNLEQVLITSTSETYGTAQYVPIDEKHPLVGQSPYSASKIAADQIAISYFRSFDLPVKIARPFNVYGPRSRTSGTYGAVFGVFLAQKLNKKPFTVVGDGTQTRDFTYVEDVTSALLTASESNLKGEIINIGSDNTYSVNRLVELLRGDVVHIPKRPGEPDCTWADISKAKNLLNWQPKVSLEEGVGILLENIDYWLEAPIWDEQSIPKATEKWFEY